MARNSRKFGTPGITTVMGDFLETELGGLPAPDAVFIGGHGGKMIEILQKIKDILVREDLTIAAAQRLLEAIKIELLDIKVSR